MKRLLLATILLLPFAVRAQQKIGNNASSIDPASILELEDSTRALYLTRVSLLSTSDVTTVPNPKAGMVVFNTNIAVNSLPNPIYTANGRGVYYFDGTGWVYSGSGGVGLTNFWSLTGNANAVDGVNFLGTTNNVALNFRVFNNKAGRIDLQGNTLLGYLAGNNLTTGINLNNTLIGSGAGSGVTSGVNNVAVGTDALQNNAQGFSNVAVGYRAGATYANSNHNTYLGDSTDITAAGINNATAIGAGARVSQSNSVILGNSAASVGIGNTAPTNKLHVTGTDPLRLEGLQGIGSTGVSGTDTVLTVTATGVVKKVGVSSVLQPIKANNGLTRTGDSIQLGGTLTKATSITTNGNNLDLFGTGNLGVQAGVNAGTVSTTTTLTVGTSATVGTNLTVGGTVKAAADTVSGNTQTGSLTVVGNTTTGGNTRTTTLTATGLGAGILTDSLLNITTGGVVRKVSPTQVVANAIQVDNGLSKGTGINAGKVILGGTLNQPTSIVTAGNDLSLSGTGNLSVQDTAAVGALTVGGPAYVSGAATITGATTTNGITNAGNIATSGNTSTSTLTATGLAVGTPTDSILNITTAGVVRKVAAASIPNNIKANNGLTRVVDSIQLGGSLTQNTTIATGGNNLALTGTGNLSVQDTAAVGTLTVGGPAYVSGAATITGATTTNGITNTGNIATSGNTSTSTLTATGLAVGTPTDSILNITTAGVVRKVAAASIPNNIKANNGLTRVVDSIQLGGTLTKATTIDQAGNTLTFNNANIAINGPTTTTGNVRINGNDTVTGNVTANGAAYVGGNTNTNTLTARNLASGSVLDSIVTINGATGIVNKRNVNDVLATIKANNGVNRTGDSIQLGGSLTKPTTVTTTAANTLAIAGLQSGSLADSIVVADRITGTLRRLPATAITNAINANNGVNRTGDSIQLGGSLTKPTTITTTGANTLAIGGLQSGSLADSIVVADRITGTLRRIPTSAISNTINANNGLTRTGDSIQLGGTLTKATTIDQAGNTLTFNNANIAINGPTTTTGNVRINGNDTVTGNVTANGAAYVGGNTNTNTLTARNLASGSVLDSIVTINGATGIVNKRNVNDVLATIKANNGLTRTGDSIQLGGTLTKNTSITTNGNTLDLFGTGNLNVQDTVSAGSLTAGKAYVSGTTSTDSLSVRNNAAIAGNTKTATLTATGITQGVSTDSVLNITAAGIVRKVAPASLPNNIKANNGLARVVDSIQLGGSLTQPTTIATSATNTLAITGLQAGAVTDSLVTVNTATGQLRRVDINSTGAVTSASNGLTKVGNDVRLGGTLNQQTTINQGSNNLTLGGPLSSGGVSITNNLDAGTLQVLGVSNLNNTNINGFLNANGSFNANGNLINLNSLTGSVNIYNLAAGAANDSILTIDPATSRVRKVNINTLGAITAANNGLSKTGNTVQLGGSPLIQPTTIATGGNDLSLTGTGNLNVADTVSAGSLTVSGNVRIAGNDTVLGNTRLNTLTATGLTSGSILDSLVTINNGTGVVNRISINSVLGKLSAGNGITRSNDSFVLGGSLLNPTTIATNNNSLSLTGTGNFNVADTANVGSLTSGNAYVNGTLRVTGNDTTGGNVTVGGATYVNGNTNVNTLTARGLTSGSILDSLVTINNGTGVVNRISINSVLGKLSAGNGITRSNDSFVLGGSLLNPTTIATNNNSLSLTGTGNFNVADTANVGSLTSGNAYVTGTLRVTGNDTTGGNLTAGGAGYIGGNLRVVGNDTTGGNVTVGGATYVNGNTNVNTLTARGLTSGSILDSLVTINNGTGVVNRISINSVLGKLSAGNGITRSNDSFVLGGSLLNPTTIATNNNSLSLTGTGNFNVADTANVGSLTSGNAYVNGTLRVTGNDTTGGNVTVGGATYVNGNTNVNTLTARGLTSGSILDSLVTINNGTGVVNRISINSVLGKLSAGNGITRSNDSFVLGGSLLNPTTIATNNNSLSLTGTGNFNVADTANVGSLTSGNAYVNGTLRVTGNDTTGGNVTVGGATYVNGNTNVNTLTARGLTSGSILDSLVTINNGTGVVNRISINSVLGKLSAGNGITRSNDSFVLGGSLLNPTTIATNNNSLSLTGTGNFNVADTVSAGALNVSGNVRIAGSDTVLGNTRLNTLTATGLTSGSILDSLVTINNGTGVVNRISINSVLGKLSAGNGITRSNDSFVLGGSLLNPTTIATNNNSLSLTGTGNFNVADTANVGSLTSGNAYVTGTLRVAGSDTTTGSITAGGAGYIGGNLRVVGNDTTGGNVTVGGATYVNGNTNVNTLTARGLTSGSILDSLVTINNGTGVVNRISINSVLGKLSAGNGITRSNDSFVLGGSLLNPTTIATNNNSLSLTGTGNFNVADTANVGSLTSGNAYVTGTLRVTGNDTTGGNLTAGGAGYIGGNLRVVGNDTTGGNVTVGGATYVNGNTNVNTLTARGLTSGSILDSLVTINNGTGVVNRISINSVLGKLSAGNGITRSNDSFVLGGSLLNPTTIATNNNSLSLTGTGNFNVADTVSAGALNVSGNVRIAGSDTVLGNTRLNTLTATGLTSGSILDSLVTINNGTGVVNRISINDVIGKIKAGNGLNRTGDSILLGGTLTQPTTVTTSATNTLAVAGLSTVTGTPTTPIVIQSTGGVLQSSTLNSLGAITTASNGIVKSGNNVALGGMLDSNTTINTGNRTLTIGGAGSSGGVQISNGLTTGDLTVVGLSTLNNTNINGFLSSNGQVTLNNPGSNLTINNLPAGAVTDSIVTINTSTNRIRKVDINTLGAITAANNGLSKTGNTVQLGGSPLIQPTTIATGGNDLSLTGTGNLNVADTVSAGSLTVSGNVRIAGNDTVLGNTRLNTLTATGLTSGSILDSLVTINNGTGVVNRISINSVLGKLSAGNGITRSNDSFVLGGSLLNPTTIATNNNSLSLTGTGNFNVADTANVGSLTSGNAYVTGTLRVTGNDTTGGNVTVGGATYVNGNTNVNTLTARGLTSGSILDSLVTINNGTGVVNRISINSVLGKLSAGNGITRSNDSFVLGGSLLNPTTIATNNNSLSLTGTGNFNVADTANVGSLTSGNAYVTGTLRVTGNDTTGGNVTVGTDAYVNGNTNVNTLTARGLTSGSILDSLVTINNGTGVVNRISINSVLGKLSAGNGITRSNDSFVLGGSLLNPTTIATNNNSLSLTGTGNFNVADTANVGSLTSGNAYVTGTLRVTGNDTTGGNVTVGTDAYVNGNTNVNTLTARGLTSGSILDSLVTINNGTGVVNRISINSVLGKLSAGNGITRSNDSFVLGGSLLNPTTIATNNNSLSLTGTGNFNVADTANVGSLTSGNAYVTGTLRVTGSDTTTGNITAGGAGYIGGNLRVAGNDTVLGNTRLNTLTATGLTSGSILDSLVTINNGTGVVNRISINSVLGKLSAGNGITRSNDSFVLGGSLLNPTTIATGSNSNTLSITGPGNFNVADTANVGSLTSGNAYVTGTLRVAGNDTTTGNLTAGGAGYIGGNLRVAGNDTVLGNTRLNTLTATGLTSGSILDSLVTINNGTGVVNRISINSVLGKLSAGNGITRSNDSFVLGGSLLNPTTIATNNNSLSLTGTGNFNVADTANVGSLTSGNAYVNGTLRVTGNDTTGGNVTVGGATYVNGNTNVNTLTARGLTSGSILDSLVTINNGTGVVNRISINSVLGKLSAGNGITRSNDSFVLGGSLLNPTTIATGSNSNTLSITGPGNFNVADTANVGSLTSGNAYVTGTLRVAGNDTTTGNLTAGGAGYIGGNLRVAGNDTVLGNTRLNTLTATGLTSGSILDSLVTINNGTGVVNRISINSVLGKLSAGNGITRSNDSFVLGGSLLNPTTIATNNNSLSLTGTGNFNVADTANVGSLTSGNAYVNGTLRVTGNDTTGGNVTVGGATYVNGNTNVNTLTARGLTSGSILDSLVTINNGTGVVNRISINSVLGKLSAGNGITRSNDSFVLGGSLLNPTTIATGSNSNTLSITGPGNFNVADTANVGSLTSGNAYVTGTLRVAGNDTTTGNLTAGGAGYIGGNLRVAGNDTVLGNTRLNTLTATGLTSGSILDSLVTINNSTGVVNRISINDVIGKIKAGNGLNRTGDSILLGGTLTQPTTVTTSATNTLTLAGLQSGTTADSFLTVSATGVIRKISDSAARSNIKANNGLTRVADSIQLGGTLSKNTVISTSSSNFSLTLGGAGGGTGALIVSGTISAGNNVNAANDINASGNANITAQTSTNTLKITTTTSAAPTDSILTVDPSTRIVKSRTVASLAALAGSGLTNNTVTGLIDLGGTLTKPTTITNGGNSLSVSGTGNFNVADTAAVGSLTSGNAYVTGTLRVAGNDTTTGNLTAGGAGYIGGNLRVVGNDTTNGNVTIGTDAYVNGNTNISTLTARNLPSGSILDSLVTVDQTGGKNVRRISINDVVGKIKADNGLTRVGDSIELGGMLKQNTTIDQNDKQIQFTNVDRFAINNSTTTDSERFVVRADGTIAMGNAPAIYPSNKVEVNLQNVGGPLTSGEENQGVNVLASALNGSNQSTALRARMNVNPSTTVTAARGLQGNVGIDGTLNGGANAGYFNAVVRSGATLGANATVTAASGDAESNTSAPTGAATNAFIGARFGANATNTPNANTFGMYSTAIGSTNVAGSNTGMFALATNGAGANTGIVAGVGGTFATTSAAMTAAKANKTAAVVGVNNGVGNDNYAGYFTGSNSSLNGRVLAVVDTITATLASSSAPAATEITMSYKPAASTTSGIIGITSATHTVGSTTANDFQAQGALMEGQATNGNGGQFHAIGGLGLGTANPGGTNDGIATVIGLSGGTNFSGTGSSFNGVGVDGFVDFALNGTTGRSAGGHFDGTTSNAPGTTTTFGMIGTVGGGLYQTFFDASLSNRNIGVAATNNNATAGDGDSSQLALYSSGAVQMKGLNGTGAQNNNGGFVLTVDTNGLVGRSSLLSNKATLTFNMTLAAGATEDQTITVLGAQDGDVVSLGVPLSAISAISTQGIFTAFVSAPDTVTVRLTNTSGAVLTGPVGTHDFKVKVMQ